jgi:hypothetical protein
MTATTPLDLFLSPREEKPMHARPLSIAAAFTLAVIGCVPSTEGELGAGQFTYECKDEGYDAACADSVSNQSDMPAKVALDAPFEVFFWSGDSTEPGQSIVISASQSILAGQGQGFVFTKPGHAAVIAREPSGTVVDFLHLQGTPVDHLTFFEAGKLVPETLEMQLNDTLVLYVEPMDATESILAGAIELVWSVNGEAVALEADPWDKNVTTLVANEPGSVQVSVTGAGVAATVQVNVGGAP